MPPQPTRQSVPDRRIGTSLAAAESPREFHPEALTDPCMTVSSHTARAIQ